MSNGGTRGPKGPKSTIGLYALSADNKQIQARAIVYRNGNVAAGVEVLFYANGVPKVGATKKTDGAGMVDDVLSIPSDSTTVMIKAEALIEGNPSKEIPVTVTGGATSKKDESVIRLLIEDTRMGPGKYRQDLIVVDQKGRGLGARVQITSTHPLRVDGQPGTDLIIVDIPADGRSIVVEFDVPMVEPDYRVLGYEHKIRNHQMYGKKGPANPPGPDDGLLKHFTGKWR